MVSLDKILDIFKNSWSLKALRNSRLQKVLRVFSFKFSYKLKSFGKLQHEILKLLSNLPSIIIFLLLIS